MRLSRFAVFATLLAESLVPYNNALFFIGAPTELVVRPSGFPFDLTALFSSGLWPSLLTGLFVLCCLLAAFSIWPHWTGLAGAALGIYVLGVPHFYDLPNYQIGHHHHLIWFACILAVGRDDEPWAVRICQFLIGLIYFFPGMWKIVTDGPLWISGEKLKWIVIYRWWETGAGGAVPWITNHPLALRIGSIATIIFEISFVFLIFTRWKKWAVMAGLGFHILTGFFLKITFWPLIAMYALFLYGGPTKESKPPPLVLAAGGLITAMVFVCGAFRIDSWPFAVYPTFNRPYSQSFVTLSIRGETGGKTVEPDLTEIHKEYGRVRWLRLLEWTASLPEGERQAQIFQGIEKLVRLKDAEMAQAEKIFFDKETINLPETKPSKI